MVTIIIIIFLIVLSSILIDNIKFLKEDIRNIEKEIEENERHNKINS